VLVDDGDEVIFQAPYWVSYPEMVKAAGGKSVVITTDKTSNFKITPAQLKKSITPKTRILILNSPSNPTGVMYNRAELIEIAKICVEHKIYVISDEIYEKLIYDGNEFVSIAGLSKEIFDLTITVNGVSKAYSMTGWRIGYAAGPADLIAAMSTIQSQSTSNPCSIAQKAAVAALNGGDEFIQQMVEAFHDRHDYVVERLQQIPGIEVLPADGTFYLFPSVAQLIEEKGMANDIVFSEALLNDVGVAMVPGSAFGTEGCIRLSFATSMQALREAMDRLERFCI